MNLYKVYPRWDYWCCYVFEETRNKARNRLVGYFSEDHEYIDFNAVCARKNVHGGPEICARDCARLEELDVRYATDEDEEWEE